MPQSSDPVLDSARHPAAIGADDKGKELPTLARLAGKRLNERCRGRVWRMEIPESERCVVARRYEPTAVGADRKAENARLMGDQFTGNRGRIVVQVPKPYGG